MVSFCFGDLRTHLLDTHDAEAEAVKYIAFFGQRNAPPGRAPHLRTRLPVGALLRTSRPTRARTRSRDQAPHHPCRIVSLRRLGALIDSRRLAAHILPDLATRQ